MNNKTAKKLRQYNNRQIDATFDEIRRCLNSYPLGLRLRFAWRIITKRF